MDDWDRTIHDLESIVAENRKHIFDATLLDRDNQLLATGKAALLGDLPIFWPDAQYEPKGIQSASAVILRHSDGTQTAIEEFRRCDDESRKVHYHFRVS